jgi:uncharacterized membrane protein
MSMAGIGFRLREFVDAGTYIGEMKGYAFAILICAGPWLITVAALGAISALGSRLQADLALFQVSLVYTYAFSLIISGLFQFTITRYMADKIFARDRSAQLPTLMGALSLLIVIQFPLAILFYAKIHATAAFRLAGITLFMTIGAIWLTLVFLGVVRAYMRIIHCFLIGSTVSVVATLGAGFMYRTPGALLWGFTLGQFVLLAGLLGTLLAEFEIGSGPEYAFLEYYRRYPYLAPCGVLFYLGTWTDEMLYWFARPGRQAAPEWFYVYDPYDVAGFLAQLTTLPAVALFFVRAETIFYEGYRGFYDGIVQKLPLAGLQQRKAAIYAAIREGLRAIVIWQGFTTFAAAAFPGEAFRFAGLSPETVTYVRIQTLSALFVSLFLVTMIIMMYFEFYREAFTGCLVLWVANVVSTLWTLHLGPQAYGTGALVAGVLGWVVAALLLVRGLRNLEFLTFVKQPVSSQLAYDPALRASPQGGFGRYVIRGGQALAILLAVGFAALVSVPAPAQGGEPTPILVLFKSSEGATATDNEFHLFAEAHAKALGFQPTYRDVDQGLPDEGEMGRYHAVVSWFRGPIMKGAAEYIPWLIRQLFARRKVVILGSFGAYTADGKTFFAPEVLNRFFLPFGLEFRGNWTDKGDRLAVVAKDGAMVEAQIPLDLTKVNHYFHFRSIHPKNRAYLSVRRTDLAESDSALVVRTPIGGLALESYLYVQVPTGFQMRLDLRRFLESVLPGPVEAADLPGKRVLGLLKRKESPTPSESFLNRYVFRPLFDLGYWLDFHYVEDGFPSAETMQPYQAVVTWFQTAEMREGVAYPGWLAQQIIAGRKVVILGNYGAFKSLRQTPTMEIDWWNSWRDTNSFFYPFGLEFAGDWSGNPKILKIAEKDPAMVEAEIPLGQGDLKHYYRWRSVHPDNKSFLVVDREDRPDGKSSLVVRTPHGGMAFEGYLFHWDEQAKALKFRLNLPAFLRECLTYQAKAPISVPSLVTHDELVREIQQTGRPTTPPPQIPAVTLPPSAGPEFKRHVLALYKRSEESPAERAGPEPDWVKHRPPSGPLRTYAETILNHLGLIVEHWDADKGLPPDDTMQKYRGILTWFSTNSMKDALGYAKWVQAQIEKGRRFVILGDPGASMDRDSEVRVRAPEAIFEALGFRYRRLVGGQPRALQVVKKVSEMVEFERSLDLKEISPFDYAVQATTADARVYLTLSLGRDTHADVVAVTSQGGVALHDFAFFAPKEDPKILETLRAKLGLKPAQMWVTDAAKAQSEQATAAKVDAREAQAAAIHGAPSQIVHATFWRIDPFRFFAEALGVEESPRPDTTTLNGQRIFYSHIDGDGLIGISKIDRSSFAGEFVRDRLLKRYNLPVSASIITREIEVSGTPTYNKALDLARSIMALENIEAASHTYSHPFEWRLGTLDVRWEQGKWVFGRLLPDMTKEILASVRFIDRNLTPPGKRTEIVLWTGATNPEQEALKATVEAGVKNLNGGDPIVDDEHPSLSSLAPLSLRFGNYWQIHTSASNDFIYTNGWTRNFGGQKKVIQHFERTETPRRLSPVNLYSHFYSGDYQDGIDAMAASYDYALKHQTAPLFASQYVSIVEDFLATRMASRPDGGWEIYNAGALRTVRFDGTTQVPDLERSRGVLGHARVNKSLYVHLDEGKKHEIYLTPDPSRRPHLRSATHYVEAWQGAGARISFQTLGLGAARFILAGLEPNESYRLRVVRTAGGPAETLQDGTIRSDADGDLAFEAELRGYRGQYRIDIEGAAR